MRESCHAAAADSSLSVTDGWAAASVSARPHYAAGVAFSQALVAGYMGLWDERLDWTQLFLTCKYSTCLCNQRQRVRQCSVCFSQRGVISFSCNYVLYYNSGYQGAFTAVPLRNLLSVLLISIFRLHNSLSTHLTTGLTRTGVCVTLTLRLSHRIFYI